MVAPSLAAVLQEYPRLSHLLSLEALLLLFRLLQCLRTHLAWNHGTADSNFIPLALPINIKDFLADTLHLPGPSSVRHAVLDDCWFALGALVWASASTVDVWRSKELVDIFMEFGIPHGIGTQQYWPRNK